MKQLIFLLILVAGILTQVNAQTVIPKKGGKGVNWSAAEQQNSSLFKSLKGQDRLSVFKQLQTLIRTKGVPADGISGTTNWAQVSTQSGVIALLGQPDVQIQKTLIEYNLSADASTKLVVGFDKNKQVVFYTVK